MEENDIDNRIVTERVKTFEDACRELEKRAESDECIAQLLADYESNKCNIKSKCTLAYMKLCIIAAALNEGWQPQFTGYEQRWYPWFTILTEVELKLKSKDWKNDHNLCMLGGGSDDGSYCGLAFALSYVIKAQSLAFFSARIAVKSNMISDYFGKQFIDIWADYLAPINENAK